MRTIAIGGREFWYGDYKQPFVQLEGAVPDYPAGTLPIEPATGKLLCSRCGKTFNNLGNHVRQAHGIRAREYKDEVGLLRGSALVSERVRQGMIARTTRRYRLGLIRPVRPRRGVAQVHGLRTMEHLNKTGRCLAQVVEVARIVARENGGRISISKMKRKGVTFQAMKPYGGIGRIAQLAGASAASRRSTSFTDSELVQMFRDLAAELGRTPSHSDMRRYGLPTGATYSNRFGSIAEAARRAGLNPNNPTPLTSDDHVAVLVAYATLGSISAVAASTHHGGTTVRAVLARYDVPILFGWATALARHEAREWAGEVARRIAGWPAE